MASSNDISQNLIDSTFNFSTHTRIFLIENHATLDALQIWIIMKLSKRRLTLSEKHSLSRRTTSFLQSSWTCYSGHLCLASVVITTSGNILKSSSHDQDVTRDFRVSIAVEERNLVFSRALSTPPCLSFSRGVAGLFIRQTIAVRFHLEIIQHMQGGRTRRLSILYFAAQSNVLPSIKLACLSILHVPTPRTHYL